MLNSDLDLFKNTRNFFLLLFYRDSINYRNKMQNWVTKHSIVLDHQHDRTIVHSRIARLDFNPPTQPPVSARMKERFFKNPDVTDKNLRSM